MGEQAATASILATDGIGDIISEEELHRLSDETIDQLKEAWSREEILGSIARPVKDSSDKPGLILRIKMAVMRAMGYYV